MSEMGQVLLSDVAGLVEARTGFPGQRISPTETDSSRHEQELWRSGPVLWGLRFGNFELCDPVFVEASNSNSCEESDEPIAADPPSEWAVGFGGGFRHAFILNDELEAEAERRREFDVVAIPERRFGKHLSDECSLRFRYVTSWPDVDVEVFGSNGPSEKFGRSFRLVAFAVLIVSLIWGAHFAV